MEEKRKYLEYFDGAFDSTVAEKIKPENKPYVAYSKTEGVVYTIIPKEDSDMWIVTAIKLKDISGLTYNIVDLGLPSGLKWADRNIGASSPEHYGSYFQWGDTNAYTYDESAEITTQELVDILYPFIGPGITVDNIKDVLASQGVTGNDLSDVFKAAGMDAAIMNKHFNEDSYFDTIDHGSTFNKYNNNGGLTVLESGDDAATTHMGPQYRMPTIDEIRELISNTIQTFIDLDGNEYSKEQTQSGTIESGKLKGVRFTSSNGNSIFIPAAGGCNESSLGGVGVNGELWSSSLVDGSDDDAWFLGFGYDGSVSAGGYSRYYGRFVRGVQP